MNQAQRAEEMEKTKATPRIDEDTFKQIKTFMQRQNKSAQASADRREEWRVMDIFDRGKQWDNVSLPPWIPKPIHNMIRYTRTWKRANLAGNIPAAHYAPMISDQKDAVLMLQRGYKHVWDTHRVAYTVRRCIDRMFLQGTSIAYVYNTDKIDGVYKEGGKKNRLYQGEIKVKRFSNLNFFPDPDAYDLESCRYIDITLPMTVDEIRNNEKFIEYAGKDKLDGLVVGTGNDPDESGTGFDREHVFTDGGQPADGDERTIVHVHFEKVFKGGRQVINQYFYAAGNFFFLDVIKDIKPSVFPFVVLLDEEEENDFWGSATASDFLEKQKVLNKTEQTASIIATLFQNPQRVVARESGINGQQMARNGTEPGKVWISNIEPSRSVVELRPTEIPQGLFDMRDRMISDIKDYSGMNEAYTGDSVGSLTTSTGVNSLIERSTIRDRDKMKQIDRFVEDLSDLIVLFIIESWKEKRPMINVGQANKIMEYDYDPKVIKDIGPENLKWFVRSDVYSSAPITQALKKQQADQILQVQQQFQPAVPIITLEEWLHAQDFDNKDEILERMRSDKAALEEKESKDFATLAMQLADTIRQQLSAGMPQEEVMQQATEAAKEMLQQQEQKESFTRPRDAAKTPAAPQGDTGQLSMNAMTKGM